MAGQLSALSAIVSIFLGAFCCGSCVCFASKWRQERSERFGAVLGIFACLTFILLVLLLVWWTVLSESSVTLNAVANARTWAWHDEMTMAMFFGWTVMLVGVLICCICGVLVQSSHLEVRSDPSGGHLLKMPVQ
jgi:hypothetical protein